MTLFSTGLWTVITLLVLASDASAGDNFFIMGNDQLVATRVDPVVSPGIVSGHGERWTCG